MSQHTETVTGGPSPAAHAFQELEPGACVADRYVIEGKLGSGGSSTVYRAFDKLVSRRIALKMLRPERTTPASIARLRREVAVARDIRSDHLVRLYDIDDSDGFFITMQLVEGESLRSRIERGPISVAEALPIAEQLLTALADLHRCGTVHRDIKPGNVVIEPDGHAWLVDFGLARNSSTGEFRATETDAIVGTWEYLAPEQALGGKVDARTDLFAFGIVLWEMLTGELPFRNNSSVAALLSRVDQRDFHRRAKNGRVPRWLVRIITRLLARDPSDRFRSADEVLRYVRKRRGPLDWALVRAAAVVFLLLAVPATAWVLLRSPEPDVRIVPSTDQRSIVAVDSKERVLWRNSRVDPRNAAVVKLHGRSAAVAVFIDGIAERPIDEQVRMLLLDLKTGRTVETVNLPQVNSSFHFFSGFSDRFRVDGVAAADIDHDGSDAIIVTYSHGYWPSYTIVYDAIRHEVRTIFAASGHHRFIGTADVNGDGRDDVLLAGINNRMAWYSGVAAIDAPPPSSPSPSAAISATPDRVEAPDLTGQHLLWYAILPKGRTGITRASVDRLRKTIDIPYTDGRSVRLGFDGFLAGGPRVAVAPAVRAEMRRSVYAALRNAEPLIQANPDAAVPLLQQAIAKDAAGVDVPLGRFVERQLMRAFIAAGRLREGEQLAERLIADSAAPGDIAFDVAQELHLHGRPADANAWYLRGLGDSKGSTVGRGRYEFLQGAVLALVQQRKWRDAEQAIARYEVTTQAFPVDVAQYLNYVHWREGRTDFLPMNLMVGDQELAHYWDLEFERRRGRSARGLLPRVEEELKRGSLVQGLLASLHAELLQSEGRTAEARDEARSALAWIERNRATSVAALAHEDLVRARCARLGIDDDNRRSRSNDALSRGSL